jgi:DNA-binding IclR family transcriptional regulator
MRTTKPYYRPVEPETVQKFWQMGLDTHEIALRTGFKESEVHRHLARWLDRKWLERRYDQNRVGSSS